MYHLLAHFKIKQRFMIIKFLLFFISISHKFKKNFCFYNEILILRIISKDLEKFFEKNNP